MKRILFALITFSAAPLLPCGAETVIALTSGNRLLTFDSATPGIITSNVLVTGLASGETLVGIDFRPFTGGLYGLGSTSRLYVIAPFTGVATAIGAAGAFTLTGTKFGFDFNPTVDRIRVTSDADQNLRLHPGSGGLAGTDMPLQYAPTDPNAGQNPNVVASAYTNSFVGAGATTLYDIDWNLDILVTQNPPNSGTLNTVGLLGVNTTADVGFDISPTTGVAFASLTIAPAGGATEGGGLSGTGLFTINLASGDATFINFINAGAEIVTDIALPAATRLLNLATRGRVGSGEDVLIGGFITRGFANSRFVLRAIGPSLSGSGVGTPLADPVLTLVDGNGAVVKTNDDWMTQTEPTDLAAINAAGLAPTNDLESAIFADITPGNYTGVLTGKGDSAGVALVEIYQLP